MSLQIANEQIKQLTAPFMERGFTFEYLYQKGGDSSCVYICRYKKGRDFFDWREVSGGEEINIVVFVNGNYDFPSLKYLYKQDFRTFSLKHIFKKATMDEKRVFIAELLCRELQSDKPDFFWIKK